MRKLLVVGAGFVGDEILRVFRAHGWEATGVSLSGGAGLIEGDVSEWASVDNFPDADAVVHCAASGRGGEEAYRKVYLQGCENLVRRFPRAKLLFTSSSSVYAQTNGEIVTEESPTQPGRETGKILLAAEKVVVDAGGIVARLAGIYGPGRSVLLRKFLSGEAVIEEDGSRYINQVHRDDIARAVFHLIDLQKFPGGQIFNVCDSVTMSQLEVYQGLARRFGRDLPPRGPRDMNRKRGWTHKQVSNEKLRRSGWEPIYPGFLDAVENL
ncbi:NAD-dependent epimerase/dehydratase family protein [Luteolibacter algae]|uniref:NAD-dependent epimerase/dehydratase family protein n=1 Tax=Luteolibacter algae TaxID=454151 RepID=A0ABW5D8T3_9BACT